MERNPNEKNNRYSLDAGSFDSGLLQHFPRNDCNCYINRCAADPNSTPPRLIKLDGTDQTITAAQAAELILLWQVYQELLTSDTAAQEEMDALVTQIQETMTTEQLQAIQAMNLTEQDVVLALQEQGVSSNVAQSNTAATSISMVGGAPGGGEMPAGDIPAGDMPPENMGQAAGSSSATTLQTAQVQPVESFPTGLIDVLVQMLENKVA